MDKTKRQLNKHKNVGIQKTFMVGWDMFILIYIKRQLLANHDFQHASIFALLTYCYLIRFLHLRDDTKDRIDKTLEHLR